MDTATVTLFLALLAVTAEAGTATALILTAGGRYTAALRQAVVGAVAPQALTLAAVVAAVCMSGSLYYSEVAHFPPCRLCWYQRFSMYPLVAIIGFAVWRQRAGRPVSGVRRLAATLAVVGGSISTYHILLERNPQWETSACDPTNPCSLIWVKQFGYLTIPAMALSGFVLILTLLAVSRRAGQSGPDGGADEEIAPPAVPAGRDH
jgi:disulfide bond formation protein DsbB